MTSEASSHAIPAERRPRLLTGLTRARLLARLRGTGGSRSVYELAGELGLHPNSVREQLDRLVESGLVRRAPSPPARRGRPALRYRAAPDVDEAASYRSLARVLADALARVPDTDARTVAAGERWGRTAIRGSSEGPIAPGTAAAEPTERLLALLDAGGFAPEPRAAGEPIRLRRCPFGPLAADQPSVVCGVHLGLMRGALEELGAPFDAVRLEPFVEPDLCVAHLAPRHPE